MSRFARPSNHPSQKRKCDAARPTRVGRAGSRTIRLSLGTMVVTAMAFLTLAAFGTESVGAATTINLGDATGYAVIGNQSITNTGPTTISGNVALSPGTSDGLNPANLTAGVINNTNTAAQQAQAADVTAYNVAAGDVSTGTVAGGNLTGLTLTPGVYTSASSLAISTSGVLTLNAQNNSAAVWVFQAPSSTLIFGSGSSVVLENGATACNIFWQVGSSATLGTSSSISGYVLALASVTLDTGASVVGGVFAQTASVTLDDNSLTSPLCPAISPSTTTSTIASSTTTSTIASSTTTSTIASAGTTTTIASAGTTLTTTAHKTHSRSTTTTTTPRIPVRAPPTGFGGAASKPSSPRGPLLLASLFVAVGAAVLGRRRHAVRAK